MAEPLALLLLPSRLEEFALRDHARDLLDVPRVVALEPPRLRPRGVWADALAARQARRLRLPGDARVLVLYHPAQYPLGRALLSRHAGSELWYWRPAQGELEAEADDRRRTRLRDFDDLAAARATRVLAPAPGEGAREGNQPLRARLVELEVISSRPFAPNGRLRRR